MTRDCYGTLPDFSPYGYRIIEQLGLNCAGGRSTYKAIDNQTQKLVVIKQFQFNNFGSSWSGFKACEREIDVLRRLNHPGIPHYLDSWQTPTGFCMLQEYVHASPLASHRQFSPQDAKHLAISILKILIYLQNQNPPVFHRDIKPENILVDDEGRVTLVDFGFARIGDENRTASSVVVGTSGFMPPEQLLSRQLTTGSDVYSLGATLVCLLAGLKSASITDLIDETYCININLLPQSLTPNFKFWLKKMVAPKLSDRFPNAVTALRALQSGEVLVFTNNETRVSFYFKQIEPTLTRIICVAALVILGSLSFGVLGLVLNTSTPPNANGATGIPCIGFFCNVTQKVNQNALFTPIGSAINGLVTIVNVGFGLYYMGQGYVIARKINRDQKEWKQNAFSMGTSLGVLFILYFLSLALTKN